MHRPVTRREIALFFAFWTFLAILSSINWVIEPRAGFRPIDPSRPILLAFLENLTWIVSTIQSRDR